MSFHPPSDTLLVRADDLPGQFEPPYLFKANDDDDSQWNLVRERPQHRQSLTAERDAFLPSEVTVIFADKTVRMFNPGDLVLVGPASS